MSAINKNAKIQSVNGSWNGFCEGGHTAVCLQECLLRKLPGHCIKESKLKYSEILHWNVPLWATLETEQSVLIAENVDPAVCSSANWFYGAKIDINLFSSCQVVGKWHRVLYSLSILETNLVSWILSLSYQTHVTNYAVTIMVYC